MNKYLLSFLKESTYGQNTINANTQTYYLGLITEECSMPAPISQYNNYWYDGKRDVQSSILNKISFDGEIILFPNNGLWFYYALGQDSCTDKGTYYEHTITGIDTGNLPSFTLHYEYDGNYAKDFYGCKVDKMTVIINENLPLVCNLRLKANNMQTGNILTTSPSHIGADEGYLFHDIITFTYNGTTYNIRHFSVSIDNQLNPIYVYRTSNQELPKYLLENNRIIAFEFSLYYKDDTFIDEVLTATARSLNFKIARGTHDFITLSLSNSYIKSVPIKMPSVGNLHETFVFGLAQSLSVTVEDQIGDYSGY